MVWMAAQPGAPTHTEMVKMDVNEFYALYTHLVGLHEQRIAQLKKQGHGI